MSNNLISSSGVLNGITVNNDQSQPPNQPMQSHQLTQGSPSQGSPSQGSPSQESPPQEQSNVNITESIQILLNGVQLAQKRGVYTLKEASVIHGAVEFIVTSINKAN